MADLTEAELSKIKRSLEILSSPVIFCFSKDQHKSDALKHLSKNIEAIRMSSLEGSLKQSYPSGYRHLLEYLGELPQVFGIQADPSNSTE